MKYLLIILFLLIPTTLDRWLPPTYGSITAQVERKAYSGFFSRLKYHGWDTLVLRDKEGEFFYRNGKRCKF